MSLSRSGFVFDEHFLAHDTGMESQVLTSAGSFELSPAPHPSSSFITKRIKEFFDGTGLTQRMYALPARAATEAELVAFHTSEYIAGIQEAARVALPIPVVLPWGEIDEDTVLSPASYTAALYAVGGALNAVQAVLEGTVRNAYALLRPPGHHATANQALGFCIFNNAVLAARYARQHFGLKRIMIVDYDVHHGNGTQDAFYADADTLFVSLHQANWYPHNAGLLEQVGVGEAIGTTVNIPLPPGTGDRGYCAAFEEIVLPVGKEFKPELIIVSAGHDGCWLDPLAHMMLTMQGFYQLSELLVSLANEVCAGRLVMLQEGGYSAPYVPYCVVASVEPLLGINLGIVDLYATSHELKHCQHIFSRDTRDALDVARLWHRQWWKL